MIQQVARGEDPADMTDPKVAEEVLAIMKKQVGA